MNRPVRENTFLLSIGEEHLDRAVREADLFRLVREVLLDLIVLEFKDLETIWEGRLSRLRFREEINNFSSWERLLNVLVLEKDNLVAVRPDLSLDTVWEDDFLLAALIELLLLTLPTDDLLDLQEAFVGFIGVVLFREDQVVFFFLFHFLVFVNLMVIIDQVFVLILLVYLGRPLISIGNLVLHRLVQVEGYDFSRFCWALRDSSGNCWCIASFCG